MIIRNKPTEDFTILRNQVLNDEKLSLKAKGLWAFLMSKPDGWQTSVRGLMSQLKDGQASVVTALGELEAAGLYRKIRTNGATGKMEWQDFVYDKPYVGNPHTEKPHMEKPPQVNTNIVKTDKVKTEISKLPERAYELTDLLKTSVLENYPFVKLTDKQLAKWAKDIDDIHRLDGYDYQLIELVLRWSQDDDFWKQNIRAGHKLRVKFEDLLVRMKSQKQRVEVIS